MVKTLKNTLLIIVLIGLLVIAYNIGDRSVKERIPEGYTLLSDVMMDSLTSLKPDTIKVRDTMWLDPIVENDRPIPEPAPTEDPEIKKYVDEMLQANARIIITDWIRGDLVKRDVEYYPFEVQTTIRQPYPVFIDKVVFRDPPQPLQLYGGAVIGRMYGVELGVVFKNDWKLGYQRTYFGDMKFNSFTVGRVFKF